MASYKKKPRKPAAAVDAPKAHRQRSGKKPIPLDDIEDPELRQWAAEVRRKREELNSPKRRRFVVSRYDVDGEKRVVARPQSEPLAFNKLTRRAAKKSVPNLSEDIKLIREVWERVAGPDAIVETRVYSFLKGVLTIEVFSSSLLQEIRQFRRHTLFASLLDMWNASQPLIKLNFRLGKK